VSRAAVPNVMTAYTYGKKPSVERNSGRKPNPRERDRRTLKRILSKNHGTTAAKVTAKLKISHKDPVYTKKKSDESFTEPTSTVELKLLNL
jgi:hypothetical protein